MDFENVYKSRSIIYKLLRLRGYDTKNYDQQTKEELNILYQNHSKKINYEMDSLDILIEGPSNKILVKYVLSEKLRGKNVEKQLDTQYEGLLEDSDNCIIITKDLVNYKGTLEEYVNKVFLTKKRYVQVLWLNRLLFDITQHELTPNYRILSEEEKRFSFLSNAFIFQKEEHSSDSLYTKLVKLIEKETQISKDSDISLVSKDDEEIIVENELLKK